MTGRIIYIEGPDRTGKSTLAKALAEHYGAEPERLPYKFDCHNAPHGTWMEKIQTRIEFLKDNELHLQERILPAFQKGETVVCDRSPLSSSVYGAQDLQYAPDLGQALMLQDLLQMGSLEYSKKLHEGGVRSKDMYYFVLMAPMDKLAERRDLTEGDPFEMTDVQVGVHEAYKEFVTHAKLSEVSVIGLDATKPVEELVEQIVSHVS